MEPLILVRYVGVEVTELEGIYTEVVTLEVRVPVAQVPNLNNNDTNRRAVAKAIADSIPPENQ
jgi:hypothetical protein